jgi:ubiquinone biosynthesis protein COQ4
LGKGHVTVASPDNGELYLTPRNRPHPLAALRALRVLARSQGKDLRAGVAFLRATEGNALRRAFDRFRASPEGRDVLDRRVELAAALLDRDALAAMPHGSLGRAFLDYLKREHIVLASVIRLAKTSPYSVASAKEHMFAERTHVMHDLWHVVTGYGTDEAGELCILAVRSAQMRHFGVWVMTLFGTMKVGRDLGRREVRAAVREAFSRGRRAEWLYGVPWEAWLADPLDVVRERLRLPPAVHYPVPERK